MILKEKFRDITTLIINISLIGSLLVVGACELTKITVYGNKNKISTKEDIKADSINTSFSVKGKKSGENKGDNKENLK